MRYLLVYILFDEVSSSIILFEVSSSKIILFDEVSSSIIILFDEVSSSILFYLMRYLLV